MWIRITVAENEDLREQLAKALTIAKALDKEQFVYAAANTVSLLIRPGSLLEDLVDMYNLKNEIIELKNSVKTTL